MTKHAMHSGSMFTLELHTPPNTNTEVLLKYPTDALPAPKVVSHLDREYETGISLNLPSVRRVLGRREWNGRPAIELEYVSGQTLSSYFNNKGQRKLIDRLKLALNAAEAIESLHAEGIIHRDIAASNLLVEENSENVVIIDLGHASHVSEENRFVFSAEGQLPYLSPEQTGRIALPVDERSDLYAFGIVMYELFTGARPFEEEDVPGWIHAHLARRPAPPCSRSPSIPQVLSDIIMRLLAKAPEHRYQSARGLRHDLKQCLNNLTREGDIPDFTLGHGDHSGRLHFPSTLYGRARGQRHLKIALDHAIKGKPRLEFIAGYAGVGKTALVNELCFPTAAAGGRFISGKFDQNLQALPYAAFFECYSQLCHQLLGGGPDELQTFRDHLLETLGPNAGLLLEFIPELEAIIGPLQAPQSLDTVASANRFAITLLNFFQCLVSEEHPLVLFLDDLQWADTASLDLLHMIVTRTVRSHYLIICAYRDTKLPPDHPIQALIDNVQRDWPNIGRITLDGLSLDQATELLAKALDLSPNKAAPLVELIHAKTNGNPFFMRQVVETLVNEDVLRFDPHSESWQWEEASVKAQDISDNVIEFMLRKIARLPRDLRRLLQAAACIGNTFPIDQLRAITDYSKQAIKKLLAPAAADGLVALLGNTARFTHDRIQQAVYQTLSQQEAQGIHLRLGRHLMEKRHKSESPLAAVRQLNIGSSLIESTTERLKLAELNLQAGHAASKAMAYGEAQVFYITGQNLLTASEAGDSSLFYELRLRQAETSFYLGETSKAVHSLHELMHARLDMSFRARIYEMLIDIHTVELRTDEALALGREALAKLGVDIPEGDSATSLQDDIEEIDRILALMEVIRIDDWPQMRDEQELAIAGILTHLLLPAYITASPEFPFLAMEFVRRTLRGGLSSFSSFAFVVYGALLATMMKRYESANVFGELALKIAQRPDGIGLRSKVNFFHGALIAHWRAPLEATLPILDAGWKAGIESGDLQIASYCINHMNGNALLAGQSLTELEQSLEQFAEVHRVIRQEEAHQGFSMMTQLVASLRYPAEMEDMPDLLIDHRGSEVVLETWHKVGNRSLLCIYHLMNCLLALVMERPVAALTAAKLAEQSIDGVAGVVWLPFRHFLHSLVKADAVRDGRMKTDAALKRIDGFCEELENWAEACPENYLPKLLLVKAERADLAGEHQGHLLDAYDQAIDAAANAGRTLDQALACERAAGYWKRCGKPLLTGLYLQQAIKTYESWGAMAKVEQLLQTHALELAPLQHLEAGLSDLSDSSSGSSDNLHVADIYSVLKAAQTVAGELVTDRMLTRLIDLVIKTAGAQSGYLLMQQAGEWRVVAEQRPERTTLEVLQWRSVNEYPELAVSVVQYVARTQQTVHLGDAAKSTLFATDSSIVAHRCKSLLCLPIINRGELAGILYLENNLAAHAFTRTHTQILQLLTSQVISSLEISQYYARVENLNRSLEEEIEERKRSESKLAFLANHDPLTNLPNRRLFYDQVRDSIQRAQRNGSRVAILFLDIDRFKSVFDTLSHQVGDRLLELVAQRLIQQVNETDTLGHLGSDEYVVLMEGELDPYGLSVVAEKLLDTFRQPFQVDTHELHMTCSLGISLFPDDATDADQLLRNADVATYQAKQVGRNTYQFFSPDLAQAEADRSTLEHDLRHASLENEFELYYQPQIELKSGRIIGAEALLRWNHPTRGLILPKTFIPLAEENGTIITLGGWVLQTACRQLSKWRREGAALNRLSVNVSGSQLAPHSEFAALVKTILDASDINPSNLELELTESVIMQDTEHTSNSLANLNALGVHLAIDDFGTGYSSLSYLHRLPVQRLKIDRSFITNLPHDHDSAMIVKSIMLLSHNLGKEIIAEGIETIEQKNYLQQTGCQEGQGYLLGAPMPLAEFTKALHNGLTDDKEKSD